MKLDFPELFAPAKRVIGAKSTVVGEKTDLNPDSSTAFTEGQLPGLPLFEDAMYPPS
jgi:hypothetical protein